MQYESKRNKEKKIEKERVDTNNRINYVGKISKEKSSSPVRKHEMHTPVILLAPAET